MSKKFKMICFKLSKSKMMIMVGLETSMKKLLILKIIKMVLVKMSITITNKTLITLWMRTAQIN